MARPPRIHFPGAFYHVIARGNQRQSVFRSDSDYQKYQERLAHYQKLHRFLLHAHAYVLMPNHVHLLIEVVKLQTVLGSDDFVEKLPVKSQEEKVHYQIPLEEIVQSVCRSY